MRSPATAIVLGAVAISTSTAARAEDRATARPSYLVQLGLVDLDMSLDRFDTEVSAFQLAAGWMRGRSFVYGEVVGGVQHGEVGERRFSGLAGAASVRVRRAIASLGIGDDVHWMQAGCWIDAGAGYQVFTWDGGRAARPELSLGVGGGYLFGERTRSLGFVFELRLIAAPGARWDAFASRCTGACGEMTPARHGLDLGAMFLIGVPFSR